MKHRIDEQERNMLRAWVEHILATLTRKTDKISKKKYANRRLRPTLTSQAVLDNGPIIRLRQQAGCYAAIRSGFETLYLASK